MIKSKLKRRLRKKFHLGEFQQFGFEVLVNFKEGTDDIRFDKFWHDFIDEIENNRLMFGGGGDYNSWQVFVNSERIIRFTNNQDRQRIKIWLEKREEVGDCKVGDFLDSWNDSKWNE